MVGPNPLQKNIHRRDWNHIMTDKNMKKNQKLSAMPKEDVQLYRLFAVFGAAIIGFAGLRLVNESKLLRVLAWGRWVALALLAAAIGWVVYVHFVKRIDESGKVFTSVGVSYFLIPILFMLVMYPSFEKANMKFQIAFAGISLFAVIYNIFKREFKNISALTFVCAVCLYYVHTVTYDLPETIFAYLCKGLSFVLPLAVIALLICAFRAKNGVVKVAGREIYKLESRFGGILTLILCILFLVASVLLFLVPSSFVYVMISLLVLYVVVGIVCTIRLI